MLQFRKYTLVQKVYYIEGRSIEEEAVDCRAVRYMVEGDVYCRKVFSRILQTVHSKAIRSVREEGVDSREVTFIADVAGDYSTTEVVYIVEMSAELFMTQ